MSTPGVAENSTAANVPSTDEDLIDYANAASDQLENPAKSEKFADNVKQLGVWAKRIDSSFDKITREFKKIIDAEGKHFPRLAAFGTEWIAYQTRWKHLLQQSRDVASATIATLKRFDKIFLDMISSISSQRDREDCIKELQSFIDEKHDDQTLITQGFLTFKRDIVDFFQRLDAFIEETGIDLDQRTKELKAEIDSLQEEIDLLDKKIADAEKALIAWGVVFNIIGLVVAGSILASLKKRRSEKTKELEEKIAELAQLNRPNRKALAQLKIHVDCLEPDLLLFCGKLGLFGQIWSAIRSQTIQFINMLQDGKDPKTNLRFRVELRLARNICAPLEEGLQRYATELESCKE